MLKGYLKNKSRKLDNTAKIFSLDDKNNMNIFRYSVILKKSIDKNILKVALDNTLEHYFDFKVTICSGFFWDFLEYNSLEPIIEEENDIPCAQIDFKKNNGYLFKITYYQNKINLDVFHVLTDGIGAIKFMKALIYNYINLKYNLKDNIKYDDIGIQDQYLETYDKKDAEKVSFKSAFLIPYKSKKNTNHTYHHILKINELKKICKKYKVTITEYLTAVYIYAMYKSVYKKKSKKEIVITVPVNLRQYYNVDTLSNFFVCVNVNPKISEKKLKNFEEILAEVRKEFKKKLDKLMINKYLARDVKLGTNLTIRLIPLFIKKAFMKYAGILVNKSTTSTLSNVGIIEIDKKYKKYIDNILVLVMPWRVEKIKCTVCSFGNNLNVTINSNIDDKLFEDTFYELLKERIKYIKFSSNN